MEALGNFLKHGTTALDWLVILVTLMLIAIALVLLVVLRSSKPFLIVIVSAVIPLAGGLLSTFLKYQEAQRALERMGDVAAEAVERGRAEAWIISYIAITGAIIIALLGLIGLVTKRRATA